MSYRKSIERFVGPAAGLPLTEGEPWADIAQATARESAKSSEWTNLVEHCVSASAGKPSKKWGKEAEKLIDALGHEELVEALPTWFEAVEQPRTTKPGQKHYYAGDWSMHITDRNADVLKGLVWCCALVENAELTRSLGRLGMAAYKKIPQVGPRTQKVGNAVVYSLGQLANDSALAQLAYLKTRVKMTNVQKFIGKALQAAAEKRGVSPEEIEEMGVPAYGMTNVGIREETIGDFTARVAVNAKGKAELLWVKADGKMQKSVPAAVKADFADDLKELKSAAKDIEKMLPAQRERVDNLFLHEKRWPIATWRERYLDHPLVGILARSLLWSFDDGCEVETGMWHDGTFRSLHGEPIDGWDREGVEVTLWHPINAETEDVVAWRERLEAWEIVQPFKQAYREIYVLTDAERNTRVYSNRFASHIVKQQQTNALAKLRGWSAPTRLMVDDSYPPISKELPHFGLRAEYWVESVGDDFTPEWVLDSGSYRYLATDQVRFYAIGASQRFAHAGGGGYTAYGSGDDAENQPIPLDEIPALALSEVLRDVDLLVGVAGVGNDPNWSDGGPEGRFIEYWENYSFGDLGETAKTRKTILERVVPRLKIAEQCSFDEKFLIVRGEIRTYKIHLGSTNILMEPNDQYLCIVPNASMNKKGEAISLPFVGDGKLSVILSKAFLLADDTKINDSTITSQIGRKP